MGGQQSRTKISGREASGERGFYVDFIDKSMKNVGSHIDAIVCFIGQDWSCTDELNKSLILIGGNIYENSCNHLQKKNPECQVGDVFMGKSGKLPCDIVMYSVMPQHPAEEEMENYINQVATAIEMVIQKALEANLSSIGFPVVTGEPCPVSSELLAIVYYKYVRLDIHASLRHVHLLTINREIYTKVCKTFDDMQFGVQEREISSIKGSCVDYSGDGETCNVGQQLVNEQKLRDGNVSTLEYRNNYGAGTYLKEDESVGYSEGSEESTVKTQCATSKNITSSGQIDFTDGKKIVTIGNGKDTTRSTISETATDNTVKVFKASTSSTLVEGRSVDSSTIIDDKNVICSTTNSKRVPNSDICDGKIIIGGTTIDVTDSTICDGKTYSNSTNSFGMSSAVSDINDDNNQFRSQNSPWSDERSLQQTDQSLVDEVSTAQKNDDAEDDLCDDTNIIFRNEIKTQIHVSQIKQDQYTNDLGLVCHQFKPEGSETETCQFDTSDHTDDNYQLRNELSVNTTVTQGHTQFENFHNGYRNSIEYHDPEVPFQKQIQKCVSSPWKLFGSVDSSLSTGKKVKFDPKAVKESLPTLKSQLSEDGDESLDFSNIVIVPTTKKQQQKGVTGKSAIVVLPDYVAEQKSQMYFCVICQEEKPNHFQKKLESCGHVFCEKCIDKEFQFKPVCPVCSKPYGERIGNMPYGVMSQHTVDQSLPGFVGYRTIIIEYDIPDGIQLEEHPNPGVAYKGTQRTAFLPETDQGLIVLKMLQKAFDQKLTFTIGRSITTGRDNVVTWNDIHHKTNVTGGPTKFGYPDPDYLNRTEMVLREMGIKPD